MSEVSVKELDELCKSMADQRAKIAEIESVLTEHNKELQRLEAKAVEYLDHLGRDSYKSPNGAIGFREQWRFNMPASPEAKQEFFNHLKEKGIFEQLITVHSQSLNSYARGEMKLAEEEGTIMEFKIPGLEAPKLYKSLTFRKA